MDQLPATVSDQLDPFEESTQALLVVAFPKSSSKNFTFALSVAMGANRYGSMEFGGKPMHVASFAKNQADAGRASALLRYVSGWSGTLLFSGGRILTLGYQAQLVIDCYISSCACRDFRAHCYQVIGDPASDDPMAGFGVPQGFSSQRGTKTFAFPCRRLMSSFRFQRGHPSSYVDQIQAAGSSSGCSICPNFNPDAFQAL